jgi:glycosyltransferase involved in cell wall biosynthesis
MRSLIIHAPNVHQGGGRALLVDMLQILDARSNCKVILDARLELAAPLPQNVVQVRVNNTLFGRLMAEWTLHSMATPEDAVLCFGNLPPLFNVKANLFVFLQNRYLVGRANLSRLPLLKRLQVLIERMWLRWRVSSVNSVIVQTPTMQREVWRHLGVKAEIIPFLQNAGGYRRRVEPRENVAHPASDFLYVASGDPHKNHVQLIEAWKLLAREGMYPSLQLTVQDGAYPGLLAWINRQKRRYRLRVENVSLKPTQDVGEFYGSAGALIYPSTLESLGLPLIEARAWGLQILAPELDYVRDLVDPEQTFDPNSPVSIARAVKRHLQQQEQALPLVSPHAFMQQVVTKPGELQPG